MRRLDRLILGEIFGPWAFGVAIFSVLILAGSFLFDLTRYMAQGASIFAVIELLILLLPGVLSKTFPMAVLLATLLAFGRLSGESEIVALKASGVSVRRIMAPVAVFGFAVFLSAFLFTEFVVPSAAKRATQLKETITRQLSGMTDRDAARSLYENGELKGFINARDFDLSSRTLRGVVMNLLGSDGQVAYTLSAPEMRFEDDQNWRVIGEATLYDLRTGIKATADGIWPNNVKPPKVTPEDILAQTLKDLDALSMQQMAAQIEKERNNPATRRDQVSNLEFGYWNKLTIPLGALVFGLVGAPLGIRNHRTGTATGFWMSVMIIFGYLMVTNVMSLFAQGGRIPAWAASFTPVIIGLIVGAILIVRKDQ
ncbi:MAG: LptF/LptG family permease [Fimbriimonadaceae bacterium]|nr:LptF/LptG family permease [Fimbriimonadaceae bacterium]